MSEWNVWQEMRETGGKILNCPHCGKILPGEIWKEKSPLNRKTVDCPRCGSQRVWKDAKRYTSAGVMQRYLCRDCDYRFSRW